MKNKIILVDADGVLVNWELGFDTWMSNHGFTKRAHDVYDTHHAYDLTATNGNRYCKMFNESVYIEHLPPLRDSVKYVKKLHEEHGYLFHVITHISDNPLVIKNRVSNLHNLFGKEVFWAIDCLGEHTSKASILDNYKNSKCLWVEDVVSNYIIGKNLGLQALLVDQNYNQHYTTDNRVYNWYDVYNRIVRK